MWGIPVMTEPFEDILADQITHGEEAPAVAMRPRLLALVFCDYGNVAQDGKFNVMGIFDRVVSPRFPHKFTFYLYVRFMEVLRGEIEIECTAPSGRAVAKMIFPVPPEDTGDEHPLFLQALARTNALLAEPGLHWFTVRYEGEELGRAPLNVIQGTQDHDGDTEHSKTDPAEERSAGSG